jgi:hypothetical protein
MTRIVNLVLLVVMIIGAVVTYDMKHKAEKAAERVAKLEAQIDREKDAMQLLRAELSMLTQPGRLQAVVDRYVDHFKLAPFTPSQYSTLDEIPMKSVGGPADEQAIADIIGENKSTIR